MSQADSMHWLVDILAGGPALSADVKAAAKDAAISAKSLRRAREQLRVVFARSGSRKSMRSTWALPYAYHLGGEVLMLSAKGPESLSRPGCICALPLSRGLLSSLGSAALVHTALRAGVPRSDLAASIGDDARLRAFIGLALESTLATLASTVFVPLKVDLEVDAGTAIFRAGISPERASLRDTTDGGI